MRKGTTTQKFHDALSNNLLRATKIEVYHKSSGKIDAIDINSFRENLDFLNESGIFADCIGWCYEDNCDDIDKVLSPVEEE